MFVNGVFKNIKMDLTSGINPSQGYPLGAQINVQAETVESRAAPPPYSRTDPACSTVTNQPTVIHQTIIIRGSPLKDTPVYFDCPGCGDTVLTKVQYVNTPKTHMMAGFVCGLTTWCMLCCLAAVPYLVKLFKRADHYCPNCHTHLGQYTKF